MTTVLAEPVTRVPRRWVSLLVLANLAVWMGFFTPIQVLLPNQLDAIDHAHKETMLGLVTALGAAAAVVGVGAGVVGGAVGAATSVGVAAPPASRPEESLPGRRRAPPDHTAAASTPNAMSAVRAARHGDGGRTCRPALVTKRN